MAIVRVVKTRLLWDVDNNAGVITLTLERAVQGQPNPIVLSGMDALKFTACAAVVNAEGILMVDTNIRAIFKDC